MIRQAFIAALVGGSLLAGVPIHAQPIRPVATLTARVESKSARPGTTVRLALHVVLPAGLHVQANKPRDPALIPTVLTIEPPAGATVAGVIYPAAVDFLQNKQTLAVYPNDFEILVDLKVAPGAAGKLTVPAKLRYQACNDSLCFIPTRAETSWTVTIASR